MAGDGVPTTHTAWWKSKTLWFNVACLVQSVYPVLPIDLPTLVQGCIGGNVTLRAVTNKPLKFKRG